MSKRLTLADKLMSECTGVMRVDDDGNYQGYYTRGQLYQEMLAQGHDRQNAEIYVFVGIKTCTEWHPTVEEIAALQREQVRHA